MDNKKRAEDFLKSYLIWPLVMSVLLVIFTSLMYFINKRAFLLSLIFTCIIILALIFIYIKSKKAVLGDVIKFAMNSNTSLVGLFKNIDIPCMILDNMGNIIWENEASIRDLPHTLVGFSSISNLFPDLSVKDILAGYGKDYYELSSKKYSVKIKEARFEEDGVLVAYLYDITDYINIRKELNDSRLSVGVIYLDNYEEVMEDIEEIRRSLLEALVDRKLNQYFLSYDAILKKIEKDRYIFFLQNSKLTEMEESKFEILEEIKSVNIGNNMSMTLSIGVGTGLSSYNKNYEFARMAIDMALGRGGDQAVIKNQDAVRYFGGKSKSIEKNTRVKARVKAHAFRELLESKDRVIIMGHKNMDIDVLGSSIGLWRIATHFGKKAHIVINNVNPSLKPIMDTFFNNNYPEDLFLSEAKIRTLIDDNTMLVVVDVNRPSITEVPDFLEKIKTVVVFDHHRQSSEIIGNATLSYVEPYASSACEMIAEIVQYIDENIKLRQEEVDAMYSGIVLDTLNFTNQTGVRTFEAAVFLKRKGADIVRVRKLFRDKLINYRAKAKAISNADIFRQEYAISVCESAGLDSPTVVGARTANELLNIVGIKASFVITPYNDIMYISARSIDEVNVQLIMEKLGGGGHRTVAGAQLNNISIEEAKTKIEEVISEMLEKGDI